MTEQINQLALTRLAFEIEGNVPNYELLDLSQGLWYAHHNTRLSTTGEPLIEQEKLEIFTTEIIAGLGERSLQLMMMKAPNASLAENPLFPTMNQKLGNIITPHSNLTPEDKPLELSDFSKIRTHNLDDSMNALFEHEHTAEFMGEYWVKRCLALRIYEQKRAHLSFRPWKPIALLDAAFETLEEAREAITQ